MFDVVKHYPWIFQNSSHLHTFDKIHTTPQKIYWQFENNYFVFELPQEFAAIDILEAIVVLSAMILFIVFIPLNF